MLMKDLLQSMPQIGTIEWIGIRPQRKAPLQEIQNAVIHKTIGLEGDHYSGRSKKRQITLIQAEYLEVVGAILKTGKIDPQLTRRNIVVSGINLNALKGQQFKIGNEVVLEMTGLCHPCSRMEVNLGPGGYNAMRGHGGITAKVIEEGSIKVGDDISIQVTKKDKKD